MKTKSLFLTLVLLALGGSLFGQKITGTPGTLVGGDMNASSAACATARSCVWATLSPNASSLSVTLSGTWSATVLAEQSADGGTTWTTVAASLANGLTTYTVTSMTDFRVRVSAYTSGIASVTLSVGLLQVQSVVAGGSSSSSSLSPGSQGISSAQALLFSSFSRKVDWSCTTGAASAIVTCTAAQFTSADVGKRAFATTLLPGGFGSFSAATTVCGSTAGTTIASFQSATQVTLSNNCSGPNSGGPFVWGPDEIGVSSGCTAAVTVSGTCTGISGLIKVAALMCGMINWPSASAIVSSTPFVNPPTTNCSNPVGAQRTGVGIIGASPTVSQLTPTPDFNMVSCNLGTSANACTGANGSGSSGGYVLEDFAWNGFGVNPTAAAPHVMIELEANTYATHVYCLGIGATNTNLIGYRWGTTPVNGLDVQADGCGANPSTMATTGTGPATCDQCYFGDSSDGVLISGNFDSSKSIYGPTMSNNKYTINVTGSNGVFSSFQDLWIGGINGVTQGGMVEVVGAGAAAILTNATLPEGRTSAAALYCNNATGSITLSGRSSVLATGTTAQSYFGIAGCTLNDFGTTKWSQTSVNTYPTGTVYQGLPGTTVLNGSCSGVATAASTLGFFGLGQLTAQTCTSTTVNVGTVMSKPGNLAAIIVTAGSAGTNGSSGVVTLLKNNVASALTCIIGVGTSCTDTTHNVSVVTGDIISAQFTTQAADTLANVKIVVVLQGTN